MVKNPRLSGAGVKEKLSSRELKFCDAYLATGKKAASAEAAGYAHPHVAANRVLDRTHVLDYLIFKTSNAQKSSAMRAHKVLLELMENANQESVRLKAAVELLNRSGLMAVQQHEHRHEVIENRSVEELKAQVAALASELDIRVIDADVKVVETPAIENQSA